MWNTVAFQTTQGLEILLSPVILLILLDKYSLSSNISDFMVKIINSALVAVNGRTSIQGCAQVQLRFLFEIIYFAL